MKGLFRNIFSAQHLSVIDVIKDIQEKFKSIPPRIIDYGKSLQTRVIDGINDIKENETINVVDVVVLCSLTLSFFSYTF